MRQDQRSYNELRPIKITRNFIKYAEGSCLIEMGNTKVIITATIDDKVPPFKKEVAKAGLLLSIQCFQEQPSREM